MKMRECAGLRFFSGIAPNHRGHCEERDSATKQSPSGVAPILAGDCRGALRAPRNDRPWFGSFRCGAIFNPKIIICIQTDGQENSSREHDWNELNDLIKEKTKAGWEFIFLGVGIDAYQQGMKMGISVGGTVSTTHDLAEMLAAYRASLILPRRPARRGAIFRI